MRAYERGGFGLAGSAAKGVSTGLAWPGAGAPPVLAALRRGAIEALFMRSAFDGSSAPLLPWQTGKPALCKAGCMAPCM